VSHDRDRTDPQGWRGFIVGFGVCLLISGLIAAAGIITDQGYIIPT
jgi:hypothetical protein